MNKVSYKLKLTLLILLTVFKSYGQKDTDNAVGVLPVLKGDTLYLAEGQKVFVGQQITVGLPSNAEGHFRSIISKKAAIVPSIWGQDKRYENAIENYVDSKKNKEKLTQFLMSVKSLTIKKIFMSKSGKPHFYMVMLTSETDECKADIQLALKLKELLL